MERGEMTGDARNRPAACMAVGMTFGVGESPGGGIR